MALTNPSVDDFKNYFFRDFPYGDDINTQVTDADIAKAFVMTNASINQSLFVGMSGQDVQSSYNVGYLLLSANFLVMNLRSSSQGLNGQFNWLEQSKGAGGVSASYAIPQRILDNPLWSMYTKTNYGAQFLEMVLPQLVGQVSIGIGSTRP